MKLSGHALSCDVRGVRQHDRLCSKSSRYTLYVSINCSALEGYIHHSKPLYTSTPTNGFFQTVTYIVDIVANIIEHVHIDNMDVVLVCLYSAIEGVL